MLGGKLYVALRRARRRLRRRTTAGSSGSIDNPSAPISTWASPLDGDGALGHVRPRLGRPARSTSTTGNTTEPPSHPGRRRRGDPALDSGPAFSGARRTIFAPCELASMLDQQDVDLGGTAPILVDLPGPPPSSLVIALGKDGNIYLVDRTNLGGVGGELFQLHVANDQIINAAASYTTAQGTYVVFKAARRHRLPRRGRDLVCGAPEPRRAAEAEVAWCANAARWRQPDGDADAGRRR